MATNDVSVSGTNEGVKGESRKWTLPPHDTVADAVQVHEAIDRALEDISAAHEICLERGDSAAVACLSAVNNALFAPQGISDLDDVDDDATNERRIEEIRRWIAAYPSLADADAE